MKIKKTSLIILILGIFFVFGKISLASSLPNTNSIGTTYSWKSSWSSNWTQTLGTGYSGVATKITFKGYKDYNIDYIHVRVWEAETEEDILNRTNVIEVATFDITSNDIPTGTTLTEFTVDLSNPVFFNSTKHYGLYIQQHTEGDETGTWTLEVSNTDLFTKGVWWRLTSSTYPNDPAWGYMGQALGKYDINLKFESGDMFKIIPVNIDNTSYTTTETNPLIIKATTTIMLGGSYKIYMTLTDPDGNEIKSEEIGISVPNNYEAQQEFYFFNLPYGTYTNPKFYINKFFDNTNLERVESTWTITLEGEGIETSENTATTTPDIISIATSTIGLKTNVNFILNDKVSHYIASIEVWNSSSTEMYYQDTKTGYEGNKIINITKDYSLENGDYYVLANIEYYKKLTWYQKLLHLGGSRYLVSVKSNIITVNITDNNSVNPVPIYDKNNGIDNTTNLLKLTPVYNAFNKAIDIINPLNHWPFSWVKNIYEDIKTTKEYYDNLDTNTSTAFAINIGGTTTTINLLSETDVKNTLGNDNWTTLQNILTALLYILFAIYLFNRIKILINSL